MEIIQILANEIIKKCEKSMDLSYSLSKAKNEVYKVRVDKFESPQIVMKEYFFLGQGTAENERTYFDEDHLL